MNFLFSHSKGLTMLFEQIYVTVGTEEKRQFLESNYGIPRNRMFSSRDANFAKELLRETGGRGVDSIVNSLVGDLLDASCKFSFLEHLVFLAGECSTTCLTKPPNNLTMLITGTFLTSKSRENHCRRWYHG